ncbi:MAG: MMPL family transporter [Phycisphaerae bacterium]|nr:MMPL family transporter [Phycisphaerae bacterium]
MTAPKTDRRWTDALARIVLGRPWTVVALSLITAIIAGAYGFLRLPLDANTDSLISRNRPWMGLYLGFLQEFGDLEYLYAVVDTKGDRAAGERAADALLARLKTMPDLPGVYGRVESDEALRIATRAMSIDELTALSEAASAIPALTTPESALGVASAAIQQATRFGATGAGERERLGAEAFFLLDVIAGADDILAGRPASGLAAMPPPEYLASDTGRLLFIAILPRKDFGTLAAIEGPLAEIRAAIDATRSEFPTVEIGLTGKPVLQADELITSTGDTTRSFAASLLLVALLCVIIYRDWRRPLLALIAFAVAIGWTHGAAALLVGRLTLLSMVFMLVLIGAGLDYGIHVVSRYLEFRREVDIRESVRRTMHTTAVGTLTGAATSAIVFVLAILSDFQGLRELGIIAGAGLVLCALAMVTTLPALLILFDRPGQPAQPRSIPIPGVSIGVNRRRARWAFAILATITVAAIAITPFRLRFESNLLKLQAQDLESVHWEHRVLEDSASLSWFAAVIAPDESSALAAIERAKREPEIGFIRSVFDVIQPATPERDELRARFASRVAAPLGQHSEAITPQALERAASSVRFALSLAVGRASDEERSRMTSIADRLTALAGHLRQAPDIATKAITTAVEQARIAAGHIMAGDAASLREALPAAIRARSMSPNGKYLVSLVPKADTWELEPLQRFVEAIRRVDPNATGVPITQSESIADMTRAFNLISLWSVLAVAVITWLDFRRLSAVFLCVGILGSGIAITVGLLALFDVPLSLANFFGVPILIGLGIDSNIHLLHRADENRAGNDPGFDDLAIDFGGTRSAVIFTSLTTAIGFGGQIFASHRGMQGLGWIMTIGSLVCLATSMWLLPAVLRLLREPKADRPRQGVAH